MPNSIKIIRPNKENSEDLKTNTQNIVFDELFDENLKQTHKQQPPKR